MATNDPTSNTSSSSGSPLSSFGVWIAGWILLIVVLVLISKTRPGLVITYYVLWLSIILLLVTHSSDISNLFNQANITQGQY